MNSTRYRYPVKFCYQVVSYFLAKNISEKIPVECSPEYHYILNKIAKRKMHSNDIKIALCEDYCLTGIFYRAVKLIEISQKNERCK